MVVWKICLGSYYKRTLVRNQWYEKLYLDTYNKRCWPGELQEGNPMRRGSRNVPFLRGPSHMKEGSMQKPRPIHWVTVEEEGKVSAKSEPRTKPLVHSTDSLWAPTEGKTKAVQMLAVPTRIYTGLELDWYAVWQNSWFKSWEPIEIHNKWGQRWWSCSDCTWSWLCHPPKLPTVVHHPSLTEMSSYSPAKVTYFFLLLLFSLSLEMEQQVDWERRVLFKALRLWHRFQAEATNWSTHSIIIFGAFSN